MRGDPRAPRVTDKQLTALRFVAILVSYGVYRLIEPRRFVAAVFVGIGTLMLLYRAIDRWALPRAERLELLEIGSIVLGLGLLGLGAYLSLR